MSEENYLRTSPATTNEFDDVLRKMGKIHFDFLTNNRVNFHDKKTQKITKQRFKRSISGKQNIFETQK